MPDSGLMTDLQIVMTTTYFINKNEKTYKSTVAYLAKQSIIIPSILFPFGHAAPPAYFLGKLLPWQPAGERDSTLPTEPHLQSAQPHKMSADNSEQKPATTKKQKD